MHKVIIIPGLGDGVRKMEWATRFWKNHGLEPIVYSMEWRNSQQLFDQKLNKLLVLIDQFATQGHDISLVGTSAGGSAALNAFMQRKQVIAHVINVCGRLRVGTHTGIHSFEARTVSSPAFAESVKLCEQGLKTSTPDERKKIMTVRPMFGDEVVPANTVPVEGAQNITIPSGEHVVTIALALTVFAKRIISFIK